MRLIFSKDRPAQLDLLLRSLERYAPEEDTHVIHVATHGDYHAGYAEILREHRLISLWTEGHTGETFNDLLRLAFDFAGETVTFFADDDILYRPIDRTAEAMLLDDLVLTFSLRLGANGKNRPTYLGDGLVPTWDWTRLDPHDHGYPGSVDGHTFRTVDVLRMIEGQTITDPLNLETVLARRVGALASERPLMACYREQALVGVNVNSVAETGGLRSFGKQHPQPAEAMNRRFLRGERISLDALDFSRVDGCLTEVQFVWEKAEA